MASHSRCAKDSASCDKILSSSRTLGVGIGVGGRVVNFVAARNGCILRVVNFVAARRCCILSSSRTSWLLLFSR